MGVFIQQRQILVNSKTFSASAGRFNIDGAGKIESFVRLLTCLVYYSDRGFTAYGSVRSAKTDFGWKKTNIYVSRKPCPHCIPGMGSMHPHYTRFHTNGFILMVSY